MKDPQTNETKYKSVEDYNNQLQTKVELARYWSERINAADRVYKDWSNRFMVDILYQFYEGYQWIGELSAEERPYVINMIYSTIETKLPSIIFDDPQFSLRARPVGLEFDEDTANQKVQIKEDALNFVCARSDFGLSDKHELCVLDAFFGFGVIETGYSKDRANNPNLSKNKTDVLDELYCKRIPFDHFRVAASANWDLSEGKWMGYYEFVPHNRLQTYKDKLNLGEKAYSDEDSIAVAADTTSGKIILNADSTAEIGPSGTCKIWHLWDEDIMKYCMYAPDDSVAGDSILEYRSYEYNPLSTLRMGKRRKGWYPYPPVWNWISPQVELNDARQAQRLHRKRFTRKYAVLVGGLESDNELDKFLYGPDGTIIKCVKENAIKPIEDAQLDPVSAESIGMTYDDFNRISGTPDEQRGVPVSGNRTTATQSTIMDRRSQIREAKDTLRVGDFMCSIGRNILRSLRQAKSGFWIKSKLNNEGFLSKVQNVTHKWKMIPPQALRDDDYDIDLNVTSVSPISAQTDKQAFMEFLALLTQYEILSFSPELIREAAYRCGYKNQAVLEHFQQFAQLASIGRTLQLKQQAGQMNSGPPGVVPGQGGTQPTQPGTLAQQQTDMSTPPDSQQIMNNIFNRQATQPQ